MITNWDIHNCLQYMSYIISQIKYLLIISRKQVSLLIVLSINTPKPTRGLDALSEGPGSRRREARQHAEGLGGRRIDGGSGAQQVQEKG